MTAEELFEHHPTIQEAVAWAEMFVFADTELREGTRRRVWCGATLDDLVGDFAAVIDETLTEDNPPNRAELLKAKEQLQSPAFREYLAGRLGLL